jgi:hypothetical protein
MPLLLLIAAGAAAGGPVLGYVESGIEDLDG